MNRDRKRKREIKKRRGIEQRKTKIRIKEYFKIKIEREAKR